MHATMLCSVFFGFAFMEAVRREAGAARSEDEAAFLQVGSLNMHAKLHDQGDDAPAKDQDGGQNVQMDDAVRSIEQFLQRDPIPCKRRIYNLGFEELEKNKTELTSCAITTYADLITKAFEQSPCKVQDLDSADVVIAPGYLSYETNWPNYGRPEANMFRKGKPCRQEAIDALLDWVPQSKKIFVIDSRPSEACHEWPSRILLASINAKTSCKSRAFYSMPPPPTNWVTFDDEQRWTTPLTSKKHFASFVGNLARSEVRREAAKLFHNPPQFIIQDAESASKEERSNVYEDALYNSTFALILRGDVEFSYRFDEAVCSGGIPVLVTDVWVPPMESVEPFEDYGVIVKEANLRELKHKLESLDSETKQRLRQRARDVCKTKLHDIAHQAAFAVQSISTMLP